MMQFGGGESEWDLSEPSDDEHSGRDSAQQSDSEPDESSTDEDTDDEEEHVRHQHAEGPQTNDFQILAADDIQVEIVMDPIHDQMYKNSIREARHICKALCKGIGKDRNMAARTREAKSLSFSELTNMSALDFTLFFMKRWYRVLAVLNPSLQWAEFETLAIMACAEAYYKKPAPEILEGIQLGGSSRNSVSQLQMS